MDLSAILQTIPHYQEFLTLEELRQSSVQLVEEFPNIAQLKKIGISTDGRPIELLTIGSGTRHALFLGVPHPNEPIGTLSLEFLSRLLCEQDDLRAELDYTFLIVKAIDPDGLVLNEGWLKGEFSPLQYALNYYRCTAQEQVEWGFPIDYKTLHFSSPSAETQVVMRLMQAYRPRFCHSLHNASFCGVYFYATRNCPELFTQFHELVAGQGLPLHHGEPEVPYIQPWTQAVYPFFGVREGYDFMAQHLDEDPALSITTGTSSADYLKQYVPQALSLVCELPYFTDPAIADVLPAGMSRRAALLEGLRQVEEIVQLIETHMSALQAGLPSSRLSRSVADYLDRTPKRLAAQRRQLEEITAYAEEATCAQAFDALVCKTLPPTLYLGEVYRLAKEGGEEGRAAEIRGHIEQQIEQLTAKSTLQVLPLKKLVAVQVGSGLLAMLRRETEADSTGRMSEKGGEPWK